MVPLSPINSCCGRVRACFEAAAWTREVEKLNVERWTLNVRVCSSVIVATVPRLEKCHVISYLYLSGPGATVTKVVPLPSRPNFRTRGRQGELRRTNQNGKKVSFHTASLTQTKRDLSQRRKSSVKKM